jgi:S-adenosylmethionine decarboxylase
MKMFVALAIFEHCPHGWLNSAKELRAALDAAVTAGSFTCLGTLIVPFSPQGITACAVVSESHLALHSWPEEGRLFIDIASCSTRESVVAAIDAIARALPEGKLTVLDERVVDPSGAAAAGSVPRPPSDSNPS